MTVYAVSEKVPVCENDKLKPISIYGLSKMIGENIISFLTNQGNMKVLILRLPGIYGGNRKTGYIFNTIRKALNNEPIQLDTANLGYWECIEIGDLCNLLHQLIVRYDWSSNEEIINISYGEPTDFVDTARFIVKETCSKSLIAITGSYSELFMSNEKLKSIVQPQSTFYESLKKYINFAKHELCSC